MLQTPSIESIEQVLADKAGRDQTEPARLHGGPTGRATRKSAIEWKVSNDA